MKALTVREVPDTVYEAIRADAKASRRSIQEQVRWVLEKDAQLPRSGFLSAARRWNRRLKGRDLGDAVEAVRSARERR
jgi:plasmid stability protein